MIIFHFMYSCDKFQSFFFQKVLKSNFVFLRKILHFEYLFWFFFAFQETNISLKLNVFET